MEGAAGVPKPPAVIESVLVLVLILSILAVGDRGDMEFTCAGMAAPGIQAAAMVEPLAVVTVMAVAVAVLVRRTTEGKALRATSGDW